MRRRALLVPVLLLSLAPAASAQACHGSDSYVDTLSISLPAAPATVRAGSDTAVPATVTRGGAPASGVMVYLNLQHGADPTAVTYGRGQTGSDGRVVLRAPVARGFRGALQVQVEALSHLAQVPCYGAVEEHGLVSASWGRAVR